jgi:hypothetical protein
MDAMMPIGLTGGRIPVVALANAVAKGSSVSNHINISNSNVGVVNTGDLARINAAITISQKSDVAGVGLQIKALTEEIIKSKEASKVGYCAFSAGPESLSVAGHIPPPSGLPRAIH